MKITAALLRRKGACAGQVAKFRELFPRGVVVTEALCVEHASVFNWDWAAENLLSVAAWAEYHRVEAAMWAEYRRVEAAALAEYQRVRTMGLAECNRAIVPVWTEYNRVRASTFGRLAE